MTLELNIHSGRNGTYVAGGRRSGSMNRQEEKGRRGKARRELEGGRRVAGNCVTEVKHARTLVAHWTKPLLPQHRCPEESRPIWPILPLN